MRHFQRNTGLSSAVRFSTVVCLPARSLVRPPAPRPRAAPLAPIVNVRIKRSCDALFPPVAFEKIKKEERDTFFFVNLSASVDLSCRPCCGCAKLRSYSLSMLPRIHATESPEHEERRASLYSSIWSSTSDDHLVSSQKYLNLIGEKRKIP